MFSEQLFILDRGVFVAFHSNKFGVTPFGNLFQFFFAKVIAIDFEINAIHGYDSETGRS
jgi:hypothetical protein